MLDAAGAGYGRLAYRSVAAYRLDRTILVQDRSTGIDIHFASTTCAIGVTAARKVIPLHEIRNTLLRYPWLAINIHSASECPFLEAIAWWMRLLPRACTVQHMMVVPNVVGADGDYHDDV